MTEFLAEAIWNLTGGAEYNTNPKEDGSYTIDWLDKKAQPTQDEIETEIIRLRADYNAKQYQRDRNYPDIGEQLDMLWHAIDNGEILGDKSCDFFKTLKKVKDDNPKPE